ncbi:MAG: RhuM family protein [bacterium]
MNDLMQEKRGQGLKFFKYTTKDESIQIDVLLNDGGVWLTQKNIAILFGVKVNTINYHIKRLKIKNNSTIREFRIVQIEGGRKIERSVVFYNFDMIMHLGFQINSESANDFREWFILASKKYLIKGFIADDTVEVKKQNVPFVGNKNTESLPSYFVKKMLYFLGKIKKKLSTLY